MRGYVVYMKGAPDYGIDDYDIGSRKTIQEAEELIRSIGNTSLMIREDDMHNVINVKTGTVIHTGSLAETTEFAEMLTKDGWNCRVVPA